MLRIYKCLFNKVLPSDSRLRWAHLLRIKADRKSERDHSRTTRPPMRFFEDLTHNQVDIEYHMAVYPSASVSRLIIVTFWLFIEA